MAKKGLSGPGQEEAHTKLRALTGPQTGCDTALLHSPAKSSLKMKAGLFNFKYALFELIKSLRS